MADPQDDAPKVTMYRTRSCPFCVMAAQFLESLDVPFEEVALDDHPDRRGFTDSLKPGHYTVPLVMVGDEPVGGFDELRALHARGELFSTLRLDKS